MSCRLQQKLINHNGDCVHEKLHVSLFQISSLFVIPKQKTRCGLANGIVRLSIMRSSLCEHCLCHLYTRMRHSRQTATSLLTKCHTNFDTSTRSAKGHARVYEQDKQQLHFLLNATPTSTPQQEVRKGTRVYTNCVCTIVVLGILLAQARPTMPCIRLVILTRGMGERLTYGIPARYRVVFGGTSGRLVLRW